jgi:hypothetical protein
MKIWIAGGGVISRRLASLLSSSGHEVTVATRTPTRHAMLREASVGHLLVPARNRVAVDRAAPDPACDGAEAGRRRRLLPVQPRPVDPPSPSPTPGSSIRRWASPKTRRPGLLPARWPPGSPRATFPSRPP